MRLLVTGFTALQVNTMNRAILKLDVPAYIVQHLRASGHEVDWRRVTPGEDLSGYDAAWVCLAPMNSLNGRAGAMGALWTLSQNIPAVGFFDDWQFSTIANGARSVSKRPETLYKHMLVGTGRGDEPATHWSRESAEAAHARAVALSPETAKRVGVERYYFNDNDENVKEHEADILRAVRGLTGPRWSTAL